MSFSNFIDYTKLSQFSGSGLSSTGKQLESAATTGTTSPGYFVYNSGDGLYWTNDDLPDFQLYESHFLLTFEKPTLPPTGDITVFVHANTLNQTAGSQSFFSKFTLWYLKSVNPTQSQDYLVASGIADINLDYQVDDQIKSLVLQNEPYENYVHGIGGYLSLSGAWNDYGYEPSGANIIDDFHLEIDGGLYPSGQSFNFNLINSTLYTKTFTANTVAESQFSGSGINELSQRLEGRSDIANSVKLGSISSNNDLHYWQSPAQDTGGSRYSHFDIPFNRTDINPTGQFIVNLRNYVNDSITLTNLQLWAKKNHNPTLSGNILIGQMTNPLTLNSNGFFAVEEIPININEGGRSSWIDLIPGLIISASGRWEESNFSIPEGAFKISGIELMTSGTVVSTSGTTNNSFNMYTVNFENSSGNFDMYLHCEPPSGLFNMIAWSEPPSGLFNMTTWCEAPSGLFDMYTSGFLTSSGILNMYMLGGVYTSGNFDMYMHGHQDSTGSVMMMIKTITVGSGNNGPDMYMLGPDYLPYSGILPLVVYFDTSPVKSFDMFLQNSNIASTGMFSMFLKAPSGTYGAVPWSGVLPLYIARDSEGIDAGLNMYIGAPESVTNSGLDMFMEGITSTSQSFDMSMSGIGPTTQAINLFTHGF